MDRRETALGDIRVLDLADEKGLYCTKLLADLGADVTKIEKPGALALDVATGTAEFGRHLARWSSGTTIIGIDFCYDMLVRAKAKLSTSSDRDRIQMVLGDVMKLPFRDNTFDCVTIAFALRNVANVASAFREMARVTKLGGKVISLELTRPSWPEHCTIHISCISCHVSADSYLAVRKPTPICLSPFWSSPLPRK